MPIADTSRSQAIVRGAWGMALVLLCFYALRRMGALHLTATLESGKVVPDTYATVDHPFHAARAAQLLDSLRHGEILRWMGSHQGGYPVEFYPIGVAWIDVAAWTAFLGHFPILAIHKLVVGLIFVLPAIAYWLLVRGDSIHPSAAFLATAAHIAIPGYWLNGGYEELVGWGLVTNVTGATFAVISTVLLARYVLYRTHWCGVAAVVSIALGTVSNPRSLFGVVIAALAIGVWSLVASTDQPSRRRLLDPVIAIGTVGGLGFLLSAPVVMALMRYSDLYFFLHYQFYDPLSMFWDALKLALTVPVLWIAIAGGAVSVIRARYLRLRVSQALAITVLLYSLFTMWVATTDNPPPLVEQLEAPRLMPFQRLLMIAIAAATFVYVLQLLTRRLPFVWKEVVMAVLVLSVGIGGIRHMAAEDRDVLVNQRALYPVETVGVQRFADLSDAVAAANEARPEGSAVFVVGNAQTWWHEQLWSAGLEPGTYYYDDWLWYWHSDQQGPYNPLAGYYMDNPADAFTAEYFAANGIGVVMVTDMWVPRGESPKTAAAESPLLQRVSSFGDWDVYVVLQPGMTVTRGDESPTASQIDNQRITATFAEGTGDIIVRQNWFPRWQASINGQPATIERTSDGYMRIQTPDGPVSLELTYAVTGLDWAGRVASVTGGVGTIAFAVYGKRLRPSMSNKEPSDHADQ